MKFLIFFFEHHLINAYLNLDAIENFKKSLLCSKYLQNYTLSALKKFPFIHFEFIEVYILDCICIKIYTLAKNEKKNI